MYGSFPNPCPRFGSMIQGPGDIERLLVGTEAGFCLDTGHLVLVGADRVMIGSDYPFDMGDADPLGSLDAAGLDPGTRGLIEGQTAAKFLRLPVS